MLRLIQKLHESSSSNTRSAAQFLQRLIQLLPTLSDTAAGASSRSSSVLSPQAAESSEGGAASVHTYRNREQFSGLCLEMLLEFAFGQLSERLNSSTDASTSSSTSASTQSPSPTSAADLKDKEKEKKDPDGNLMLDVLLARCRSILTRFLQDQQLGGSAPLTRYICCCPTSTLFVCELLNYYSLHAEIFLQRPQGGEIPPPGPSFPPWKRPELS